MKGKLRSTAGITLIEIISTVVIIGVIAAIAVPRFQTAFERVRFRSANRDIVSTLRLARSMALNNKVQYGIYFNSSNMTVTLFKDTTNPIGYIFNSGQDSVVRIDTLPMEIVGLATDVANDVITFAPNGCAGFSGGGNIRTKGSLSNVADTLRYQHNILLSTGRVHSEPNHDGAWDQ